MVLNYKEGKGDKIHIYVDGEYKFTVDKAYFALMGLYQNKQTDETELEEIGAKIHFRRGFNQAVSYLSRRDHSKRELMTKLMQKGYSDIAEDIVASLEEKGYVDDRRFAEMYVRELVNIKKFGKKRIEQELYRKGISRDIVSVLTEDIQCDSEELILLIKRKYLRYLNDEKGVRRTVNSLIRLGYSYSDIRDALSLINDENILEVTDV